MNSFCFLISLLALPSLFSAQQDRTQITAGFVPDTVKIYDCTTRVVRSDWAANSYSINGKEATEQEYKRVESRMLLKKNCTPCYLKTYTLEEKLVSEGLYYHVCDAKQEPEVETIKEEGNTTSYRIKSQSCKDGWWLYYDADGKIEKKEKFEKGK